MTVVDMVCEVTRFLQSKPRMPSGWFVSRILQKNKNTQDLNEDL